MNEIVIITNLLKIDSSDAMRVITGVATMTRAGRVTLLRFGLLVIAESSIHPDGD